MCYLRCTRRPGYAPPGRFILLLPVGLLWLEPGSLGEGTEQTWQFAEFPAPNGEAAAVSFLNEPARQGPGEFVFGLIMYGTPVVAVVAVALSFLTARRAQGVVVPIIAWALLVIAALVLALTFQR